MFINEDIVKHVSQLKEQRGKDISLVGGGKIIQPIQEADIIDEMVINMIPIVLGSGIPLFLSLNSERLFNLIHTESHYGLVMLTYVKHKS